MEIVIGSGDGKLYAWNHDGSLVFDYDTGNAIESSSPALGDIDSDADIEIVFGSNNHKLYALHHDGSLVSGFPITTLGPVQSSPLLGNLDRSSGDTDIEIVVDETLPTEVSFTVNLDTAETVQDVINLINAAATAAGATIQAGLAAVGNGIALTDTSSTATPLSVRTINLSDYFTAAE